jgi:type I restriction enzyme S subunit
VYPKDLAQLEAVSVPKDLLDAFASQIEPIFGVTMRLAAKVENLRRTRDLLLPRLLSGQINVEEVVV